MAVVVVAIVLGAAMATSLLPDLGPGGRLPHAADDPDPDRRYRLAPVADRPARARRAATVTGTGPLQRRAADLEALGRETWDVVIVGGGIVGTGALLDAVSRGMRAVLIEQEDIASGTSSRSSRLIHGGLRYLEQFRIGLVREALAERSRLLALAPHLVHLEPLLFPIYGTPYLSKAFYDAGLTLYDILGARHDGGWHRRLTTAQTLALAPTLRHAGLRGGLLYHDGVEDDARYTLAVARTAMAAGAVAVTRVRATGVRSDPDSRRIEAVRATDLLRGDKLRDPDAGRRGRDRGLGGRARPSARERIAPHPAEPRRAPRGPARADPEPDRPDHPGAGQDRLPRALGRALADRHDGRAVRGSRGAPDGGRLGGRQAARHGQCHDDREPRPGRRRRHLRRPAAADRAVCRIHGQGLARASGHRRGQRRRADRRRQVHDLPGDGARRDRRGARPRRRADPP